jgi:hypothetical protein
MVKAELPKPQSPADVIVASIGKVSETDAIALRRRAGSCAATFGV